MLVVTLSLFYKNGAVWCILDFMLGVCCLFSLSLADGHSLCFQFLGTPNGAAIVFSYVSICIHTFISVGLVPRSGSASLKSIYIHTYIYASTFNRVDRLPFKEFLLNSASSHVHQRPMRLSFSSLPYQSDECKVVFHFY